MRGKWLVSDEAKQVWGSLSVKQRAKIDKYNPFKEDRNKAIRELRARGVRNIILAEITGLSSVAICYICKDKSWRERKEVRAANGSSGC